MSGVQTCALPISDSYRGPLQPTKQFDPSKSIPNPAVEEGEIRERYRKLYPNSERDSLGLAIAEAFVTKTDIGRMALGGGLIASGSQTIAKRFGGKTSLASVISRWILPKRFNFSFPSIVRTPGIGLRIAWTPSLGGAVGRAIPVVGWLLLAREAGLIVGEGMEIDENKFQEFKTTVLKRQQELDKQAYDNWKAEQVNKK